MMLVMVLVLSELLISDVTAVILNRILENREPKRQTDQSQDFKKGPCADGWIHFPYFSSCYKFFPLNRNWIDAELYCQSLVLGGHLTAIHSNELNQFIVKLIGARNRLFPPTWIGLSDAYKEGSFFWSDGSSLGFRNWIRLQPDNRNGMENCVITKSGGWNDWPCKTQRPFICSYQMP
ncbi:lectin-like [Heterodontus francisci]|uniref:lectin-like n=1 Tax=Heterodontus francisci TaxID=7792 RepID=UPI00355C3ED3